MTQKSNENGWGCNENSKRRDRKRNPQAPGQARNTILSRISRAGFTPTDQNFLISGNRELFFKLFLGLCLTYRKVA